MEMPRNPHKPRICRQWDARNGAFFWTVANQIPVARWTGATDVNDRKRWVRAYQHCTKLNSQ